jgi:farnesyl-diphosphate farnesyltransferase
LPFDEADPSEERHDGRGIVDGRSSGVVSATSEAVRRVGDHDPSGHAARAWCRAILPRVSRTFAINIRLLRGSMGEAVSTAYLLCRAADALEDSWPGQPAEIRRRFSLFLSALSGEREAAVALAGEARALAARESDLELVVQLPRVLACYRTLSIDDRGVIAEGVRTLATGMSRYATRAAARGATLDATRMDPYLENEAELHDYCWVVAGCVGVLLTRLFELRAPSRDDRAARRRLELAPIVGEALQLTNILLDWPLDMRRGRCHVPRAWLDERHLAPADLVASSLDAHSTSTAETPSPGAREIVARLESLARLALARVPDYLDTIPARHVRYRLFCLWPALWAKGSLDHAARDPGFPWGSRRPRLPRGELWGAALRSLLEAADRNAPRRMLGSNPA